MLTNVLIAALAACVINSNEMARPADGLEPGTNRCFSGSEVSSWTNSYAPQTNFIVWDVFPAATEPETLTDFKVTIELLTNRSDFSTGPSVKQVYCEVVRRATLTFKWRQETRAVQHHEFLTNWLEQYHKREEWVLDEPE